ncbi:hypothetical protein M2175_003916 [Bradyrhizobium elkanii]|nr:MULTISPECIES: hypothetical protein [Bradyrhizobium]MCS3928885.1 hypothetical protein [Bradyrhizobium elkanii]MCS3969440.1 hypothetical protein [Bradyrhizobium japonicum]
MSGKPVSDHPERTFATQTLALRSSVREVNDKFGLTPLHDRLGGQLGLFSGGETAELLPDIPRTTQSSKLSSGTT